MNRDPHAGRVFRGWLRNHRQPEPFSPALGSSAEGINRTQEAACVNATPPNGTTVAGDHSAPATLTDRQMWTLLRAGWTCVNIAGTVGWELDGKHYTDAQAAEWLRKDAK